MEENIINEKKNNISIKQIIICICLILVAGFVGYYLPSKTKCLNEKGIVEKVVTNTVYTEVVLKEKYKVYHIDNQYISFNTNINDEVKLVYDAKNIEAILKYDKVGNIYLNGKQLIKSKTKERHPLCSYSIIVFSNIIGIYDWENIKFVFYDLNGNKYSNKLISDIEYYKNADLNKLIKDDRISSFSIIDGNSVYVSFMDLSPNVSYSKDKDGNVIITLDGNNYTREEYEKKYGNICIRGSFRLDVDSKNQNVKFMLDPNYERLSDNIDYDIYMHFNNLDLDY